jgi:putative spermidine/putrescine transport system permease protein
MVSRPSHQGSLDVAPTVPAAAVETRPGKPLARHRVLPHSLLLLVPASILVLVGIVIPVVGTVYFSVSPHRFPTLAFDFTLQHWVSLVSSPVFGTALFNTVRVWLLTLVIVTLIAYPVAFFLTFGIASTEVRVLLLVLAVIPFWTSLLIRTVAWRPLLGTQGAINLLLLKLGVIDEPMSWLLFSEPAMLIGMVQVYSIFMVGPLALSMGSIDRSVLEAARDLGATQWKVFWHFVVPLSRPGLIVGAIFITIAVMGEFAVPAALSGRKVNLLGNIVVTQVSSLRWGQASAAGVILALLALAIVAVLLRSVDLRRRI